MSNNLTPTELQLAAVLLETASDKFSNHVCNDFSLEFLPLDERRKLVKAVHEWNGDLEEYDENYVDGFQDYALMAYLSHRFRMQVSDNQERDATKDRP